jgi:hypothetical protein
MNSFLKIFHNLDFGVLGFELKASGLLGTLFKSFLRFEKILHLQKSQMFFILHPHTTPS